MRLTQDMLNDPAYKGLSSSAKVLYLYMKAWACGRDTVEYAAVMAADLMDAKTFRKARDELVKKGFIEDVNRHCVLNTREPPKYEFSSRWWTGKYPTADRVDSS